MRRMDHWRSVSLVRCLALGIAAALHRLPVGNHRYRMPSGELGAAQFR